MADVHLAQMFFDRALARPNQPAFVYRTAPQTPFTKLSFGDAAGRARCIAAGLLSLDGGFQLGERASILCNTRLEWILCDYAILACGGHSVPIYASLLTPEVGYIQQDTEAVVTFVEDSSQLEKVRALRKGFEFFEQPYGPDRIKLRHIVVVDPTGIEAADDWESLESLEARGKRLLETAEGKQQLEERLGAITREQPATYVYTSGTTGPPKGVTQTHHNVLSLIENSEETQMFADEVQTSGAFLFLPLAHSFGRLIEFGGAFFDTPIILSSPDTLLEDLQQSRPGFFPAAPRVYEKIFSRIHSGVEDAAPHRKALFRWSMRVGAEMLEHKERGTSPSWPLSLQHKLADKLVHSKIRQRLGLDRIQIMLSGSAPLTKEVQTFFGAAGLIIYEAYGLTETSPGLTANRPDKFRRGTVGPVLAGVEVKIAEDGEILARGSNITPGYLNRPDANAEAFDADGWFHTGDIGEFDNDGFLKITDRKKDLIKTSGGKYVAPQKIEGYLKTDPLIFEAVVIGDGRRFCTALVAVDPEELETFGQRHGIPAERDHPKVLAHVQKKIDDVNAGLASFESVKYFRLMDEPPSVDNGMLTASFKVKRRVVSSRYAALIDEMYDEQAKAA